MSEPLRDSFHVGQYHGAMSYVASKSSIACATDHGSIAWSPSDLQDRPDDPAMIHAGYLNGDPGMRERLYRSLDEAPDVAELTPETRYTFTELRKTLEDLVAAMVLINPGRSMLNEAGWKMLEESGRLMTLEDPPEGAVR